LEENEFPNKFAKNKPKSHLHCGLNYKLPSNKLNIVTFIPNACSDSLLRECESELQIYTLPHPVNKKEKLRLKS